MTNIIEDVTPNGYGPVEPTYEETRDNQTFCSPSEWDELAGR